MTLDSPLPPTAKPHPARSRRLLLAGLLAVFVVLAAVTGFVTQQDEPVTPSARAGVHEELCDALHSSDPDAAAARFTDRIHTPLHELAAAARRQDRAVAARLLEAKQRVEADLDHADPQQVLPHLAALEPAVREALAIIGTTTTPCGGTSS